MMKKENKMSNEDEKLIILDDEKKILLDHDYDGIRELNHPLPKWWLVTFYITIIFAAYYYVHHTFLGAKSLDQEYQEHVAQIEAAQAEWQKKHGGFNWDKYNAYIATPEAKKLGAKRYKRKCKACHAKDGGGGVGPNLTDDYWIHGSGDAEMVYNIINQGVVDKGMQAWKGVLSEEEILAVTAHVVNLRGTTPSEPKEPQGELVE
ncbi:MAG: hypothetical protein CME65_09130 [Halobacteriovoraceae bacterium]|nr:hypothetical protein [Halobacteriovoraceae bacterium]